MNRQTANLRCETLAQTTGLLVRSYSKAGVEYFQFGPPDRTIITVATYRKARCFAQGFAAGREYEKRPSFWDNIWSYLCLRKSS